MVRWSFLRKRTHEADFHHTCSACSREIKPGETYDRTEGICEGRWTTWKKCLRCVMGEENLEGAYYTPEQALSDYLERHPYENHLIDFDGRCITLYGYSIDCKEFLTYQSFLIPRTGLTEWELVDRSPR